MYPHDNIFNIYYNIGRRTPFLVKRCERGLLRSQTEERRIDLNKDRTYLVEEVYPRGKFGKAFGRSYVDGILDESFGDGDTQKNEIPCAGCGEWVLIDVPGVSLDEVFPVNKAHDKLMYGKYEGKTFGEVYVIDTQYLYWLESTDRFLKIDFEELEVLYPEIAKKANLPIEQKVIDFGKYKGQTYGDIKEDQNYLGWLVSINKLPREDFEKLLANSQQL